MTMRGYFFPLNAPMSMSAPLVGENVNISFRRDTPVTAIPAGSIDTPLSGAFVVCGLVVPPVVGPPVVGLGPLVVGFCVVGAWVVSPERHSTIVPGDELPPLIFHPVDSWAQTSANFGYPLFPHARWATLQLLELPV